MAPETASTTDVCPFRAAHGALAVRHVHVTPAAERARHLTPVAPNRNSARAAADARRGPSYKYRKPPPCDGRARTAPRRTHALATNTRGIAIRWKLTNPHVRSHWHAYPHGHARTQIHVRAHPNEHKHTNEHMRKRTRSLHAHACTPETPVEDAAHPRYPLSIPWYPYFTPRVPLVSPSTPRKPRENSAIPRRHRAGTASAPRWCSAEKPSGCSQSSLETREDRAVLNRARLKYSLEYPESTP